MVSGRDHWPGPLRRLRRRTPASADDFRAHGTNMVLNGEAMLLIVVGGSLNALSVGGCVGGPASPFRFVIFFIAVDPKSTPLDSRPTLISYSLFFFNDPAPTEIYPLPLPDALPISIAPAPAGVSR